MGALESSQEIQQIGTCVEVGEEQLWEMEDLESRTDLCQGLIFIITHSVLLEMGSWSSFSVLK